MNQGVHWGWRRIFRRLHKTTECVQRKPVLLLISLRRRWKFTLLTPNAKASASCAQLVPPHVDSHPVRSSLPCKDDDGEAKVSVASKTSKHEFLKDNIIRKIVERIATVYSGILVQTNMRSYSRIFPGFTTCVSCPSHADARTYVHDVGRSWWTS